MWDSDQERELGSQRAWVEPAPLVTGCVTRPPLHASVKWAQSKYRPHRVVMRIKLVNG